MSGRSREAAICRGSAPRTVEPPVSVSRFAFGLWCCYHGMHLSFCAAPDSVLADCGNPTSVCVRLVSLLKPDQALLDLPIGNGD